MTQNKPSEATDREKHTGVKHCKWCSRGLRSSAVGVVLGVAEGISRESGD